MPACDRFFTPHLFSLHQALVQTLLVCVKSPETKNLNDFNMKENQMSNYDGADFELSVMNQ